MSLNLTEIEHIVAKTEELVVNKQFLKVLHNESNYAINHTFKIRLSKWLKFFNDRYNLNYYIYSNTIYVLFEACLHNELFKNQTEHEFEQSLCFYDKIINHPYLKNPFHFNHAKQILGLALIYGKYGSMQINSFKDALEKIKTEISENTLHDFFKCLFVKGEYPILFPINPTQFNESELELLMNSIASKTNLINQKSKYELNSQVKAIKYFFEQMDIEMIDAFLSDEYTYQNSEKKEFLYELSLVFEQFQEAGDAYLIAFEGTCNSCIKGKFGYTFVGNVSHHYISIIFDIKDDKIVDLYNCASFKNRIGNLELNKKLNINLFNL